VRANRNAAKIKDAVKVVDGDSKATFDLAAMLEKEQGLAYAVDVLETQLSAPKADDREKLTAICLPGLWQTAISPELVNIRPKLKKVLSTMPTFD
jgi:hypothetical protein